MAEPARLLELERAMQCARAAASAVAQRRRERIDKSKYAADDTQASQPVAPPQPPRPRTSSVASYFGLD